MCKNLVSSLLANHLLMGRNFDSITKNTAFVTNQLCFCAYCYLVVVANGLPQMHGKFVFM